VTTCHLVLTLTTLESRVSKRRYPYDTSCIAEKRHDSRKILEPQEMSSIMLTEPQSVTTDAAHSLPRTGMGSTSGAFENFTDGYELSIVHDYSASRQRHVVWLEQTKIVTDPLFSTQNKQVIARATLTVSAPPSGFTPTQLKELAKGLMTNLTASTDANLIKVIGGES